MPRDPGPAGMARRRREPLQPPCIAGSDDCVVSCSHRLYFWEKLMMSCMSRCWVYGVSMATRWWAVLSARLASSSRFIPRYPPIYHTRASVCVRAIEAVQQVLCVFVGCNAGLGVVGGLSLSSHYPFPSSADTSENTCAWCSIIDYSL